jgi:hypothetical protein
MFYVNLISNGNGHIALYQLSNPRTGTHLAGWETPSRGRVPRVAERLVQMIWWSAHDVLKKNQGTNRKPPSWRL